MINVSYENLFWSYYVFRNQIKGYFWKKLEKLSYGMSYSYLLPGKWFIFWLLFLDTTGFENSYCHSKGYQGNFLFHEVLGGDKYTEYSTHVSIVRPYHTGCYFKILFDGNELEDTIYLLSNREVISQNKIWHMSPIYNGINQYQYDQFLVTKVVANREGPIQNKQSGKIVSD